MTPNILRYEHVVLGPLYDSDVIAGAASLISLRPQPLIAKIFDVMPSITMVSSKFGDVPKGSLLSYQYPAVLYKDVLTHPNAPESPPLPVPQYRLPPHHFVPGSWTELLHMQSLKHQGSLKKEHRSNSKARSGLVCVALSLRRASSMKQLMWDQKSQQKRSLRGSLRVPCKAKAVRRELELEPQVIRHMRMLMLSHLVSSSTPMLHTLEPVQMAKGGPKRGPSLRLGWGQGPWCERHKRGITHAVCWGSNKTMENTHLPLASPGSAYGHWLSMVWSGDRHQEWFHCGEGVERWRAHPRNQDQGWWILLWHIHSCFAGENIDKNKWHADSGGRSIKIFFFK